MPEICRFFGIGIKMFFGDHVPPHFHAEYGEFKAQVDIRSLVIIAGDLPPRALGMVVEVGIATSRGIEEPLGVGIQEPSITSHRATQIV